MYSQTLDLPTQRFRRFGPFGPAYEILDVAGELPGGDRLLRIRILESGEETEYSLSHAIQDPEAD